MEYTLPIAIVLAAAIYGYSHMAAAKIAQETAEEDLGTYIGFETDPPPGDDDEDDEE